MIGVPRLNFDYTVFATVESGMSGVDAMLEEISGKAFKTRERRSEEEQEVPRGYFAGFDSLPEMRSALEQQVGRIMSDPNNIWYEQVRTKVPHPFMPGITEEKVKSVPRSMKSLQDARQEALELFPGASQFLPGWVKSSAEPDPGTIESMLKKKAELEERIKAAQGGGSGGQ